VSDLKVIDFDAGWAEQNDGEPLIVVVKGKKFELPADVPAKVLLMMDRLMLTAAKIEQSGEVPDDFVIEEAMTPEGILRGIVAGPIVDEWIDSGLGYRQLMDMVRRLNAYYRGERGEDGGLPNRAARRQQTKPTGKATSRRRSSGSGAR
jgi:hypothetical protein